MFVNGRQFVIATLFTLVLLIVAFTPISSQQGVREYDPWADINEDGKIDIKDLVLMARLFGTTGVPINKTALLLELQNASKEWHLVTSFTLSSEERVSSLFFVQGEKWRIKWEPQWAESGLLFWVWDENGYVLDLVNGGNLLQIHHDAKGIHYMPHGEGSFYIEIQYIGTNSIYFTIESYH